MSNADRWSNGAPSQVYVPNFVELVRIVDGAAVPANPSVYFQVPIVDARLRVKIATPFIMAAGSAFEVDLTGFAALWLSELEQDQTGVSGRLIPCTNIEGTAAAPTAVPAAAPLMGYAREFVSSAVAIQGKLTILSNVTLGAWVLQVSYQPQPGVRFTPDEWQELRSRMDPRRVSPLLAF